MYTNIPNKGGILAAEKALNRSRRGPGIISPSMNDSHFLQIKATTIGMKLAPGIANHNGDCFERLFVYLFQPLLWLRFTDDIFIIWTHGEEALHEFVEYLNTRIESMQFICE